MMYLARSMCFAQQQAAAQPSMTDPACAHIEELKAKAEHKGEADRGRIYADIAHELVELANSAVHEWRAG